MPCKDRAKFDERLIISAKGTSQIRMFGRQTRLRWRPNFAGLALVVQSFVLTVPHDEVSPKVLAISTPADIWVFKHSLIQKLLLITRVIYTASLIYYRSDEPILVA